MSHETPPPPKLPEVLIAAFRLFWRRGGGCARGCGPQRLNADPVHGAHQCCFCVNHPERLPPPAGGRLHVGLDPRKYENVRTASEEGGAPPPWTPPPPPRPKTAPPASYLPTICGGFFAAVFMTMYCECVGVGLSVGTHRWTFHCFMAKTKVTITEKNQIYHWENLVRPFLVHTLLGPRPPPPLLILPWLDSRDALENGANPPLPL